MTQEFDDRRRKLEELRAAGHDPYGRSARGAGCVLDALRAQGKPEPVRIGARIGAIRGHGKASFVDLRDETGRVQAYFREDRLGPERYALFKKVDVGDHVAVVGKVDKTKTGETTIFVEDFEVCGKALRPLPEKWHGLKDVEARYRRRYLDLVSNPEVLETFRTRSRVLRSVRRFFDERGFLEVETPMMQPIPGGAAARPFVTHHNALDVDLFLRIAPELYLKRLLVGGFRKVYEVNRNFRNEGISHRHNPEFTMLELYWAFADYTDILALTEELIHSLAVEIHGAEDLPYDGKTYSLKRPWARRAYADLLKEHAGIALDDFPGAARVAHEKELHVEGLSGVLLVAEVFDKVVEPALGGPVFVVDYPVAISPLARRRADRPDLSERFELFFAGMEIANAFSELNDPIDQRRRFEDQLKGRAEGMTRIDEDFLLALEHGMPPAGGLGIGIDRLVMLLTGRASIREVILFPLLRPEE